MPHLTSRRLFTAVFLVAALAFSLSQGLYDKPGDIYGPFNSIDCFYYYNLVPFLADNIMVCLTMSFCSLFVTFVSDNITALRYLAWSFCVASLLLPYFIFCPRERRWQWLPYLGVGLVLLGNWTIGLFSPYAPSLLVLTAMLCVTFKMRKTSALTTIVLAMLTAISVACRFPNIVVLPLIVAYIFALSLICRQTCLCATANSLLYVAVTLLAYPLIAAATTGITPPPKFTTR